jgi:hypothetical protein
LASGKSLTEDQQRATEHYNKVVANLQDIWQDTSWKLLINRKYRSAQNCSRGNNRYEILSLY